MVEMVQTHEQCDWHEDGHGRSLMCADAIRISASGGFHVSDSRNTEIARRQVECWGSSVEASHPGPVAARSALGVCGSVVVLVQLESGCLLVFVLQGKCRCHGVLMHVQW